MADGGRRPSLAERLGISLKIKGVGGVAPGIAGELANLAPSQEAPDLPEGAVPEEEGRSVDPMKASTRGRYTMGSGAAELAGDEEAEPPTPMRERFREGVKTELTPASRDLMIKLLMSGNAGARKVARDVAVKNIEPKRSRAKRTKRK